MDTSALKTFAPAVRKQLIEAVTRKLDFVLTGDTADLRAMAEQRKSLAQQVARDRAGLIERVAYTWFNRLAAIRFLDARGWHPFQSKVLTPASPGEMQPELLKLARTGSLPQELRPHTDPNRLNDLLDGRLPTAVAGADPQGEVYRHLVLAVCRFYHATLPFLFEQLNDETELLLPDDLLTATSVAEGFRTQISDEDCKDVEILGWLYQFYISEKKDAVMARNAAVPKEDIPAVTQLFTPHWIVRYLVENSLGRLWLLNRPQSRLREHMPYYIEGEPETDFLKIAKPEDIRLLDPAVGSAHMLTYAFDLLVKIYEEEGYPPSQIAELILTHNLHGLDICPRAAQLAQFALLCKARELSRSAFRRAVAPKVLCLEDVRFEQSELRDYIRALGLGGLFEQPVFKLLRQFEEATNFGSLIQPCLDERAVADLRNAIGTKDLGGQLFLHETHRKVLRVLEQAEALTKRYHVVVANPPYMGAGQMNPSLKEFIEGQWTAGKSDSYAAFIVRNAQLVQPHGVVAMITIPNWMFLTTFQPLRENLLQEARISSLIQCGRGVWGADFGSCAFVLQRSLRPEGQGTFRRLFRRPSEVQTNEQIEANFFNTDSFPVHSAGNIEFRSIPGTPIAYWLSPKFCSTFRVGRPIGGSAKKGLSCSGTELFYRYVWEVELSKLSTASGHKWFPITKGGTFRKWYGNNEYVINWENNGAAVKGRVDGSGRVLSAIRNESNYFQEGASWNDVSIGTLCCRYTPRGSIPTDSGPMLYSEDGLLFLLSFMNSTVARKYAEVLCPTVHFGVGQIASFPLIEVPAFSEQRASTIVDIARTDWDNFETSRDFRDQPLLRPGLKGATLEASWRNWEAQSTAAIRRMQELETENNRIFIAAYGLDGELQPEVPEEQITLARADQTKDAAALLSYAVGCMMGRYSLDQPGLILADAGATLQDYLAKVPKPTFAPDADGIIPVLDGEWFEDDVVARTREFLRVAWDAANLGDNVGWLEQALAKDLRKYFLRDFYKNHLSNERAYGYKKRPIYWMVQSRKAGFQCLIYLHRYTKDTLNIVLNRYLRPYQVKLRHRIAQLDHDQIAASTAREKTAARKESEKLTKILRECEDWERDTLLPLAQARIELDLDDGVKVNYLKLGEALAPIPGLAAKEED